MTAKLVERARHFDRHSVARLVSLFEDQRAELDVDRDRVLELLAHDPIAPIVGITGTPGSGKSTLLARLTERMLAGDPNLRIAVVAIDPSSPTSGGALLGDRTRLQASHNDDRLFFRSQASATALGGLAPTTFDVCRALRHLVDLVMVETVGIGQSEADIGHLADRSYLVIGPLGGDEVQYLKAGVIEVPDAFVVSKWDEPTAERAYHQLRGSLWLARPFDVDEVPIFATSARTGEGVGPLADDIRRARPVDDGTTMIEYAFGRWVELEWGRVGVRFRRAHAANATSIAARTEFSLALRRSLAESD